MPSGSMGSARMSFDIGGVFKSAIALVSNPVNFLRENKDVVRPVNSILISYVAILAAIPFVATLIGDIVFYNVYAGFAVYAVVDAILRYILSIGEVFVVGMVIWKLAPTFGTATDQARSTMLAAYMFTPVFLISILDIVPYLGWIGFLGLLYGLYILYLGIPIMFNTPPGSVIGYTIGILVVSFIVVGIIYAIIGVIDAAIFLSGLRVIT
jgi:hypothetical protein